MNALYDPCLWIVLAAAITAMIVAVVQSVRRD